MLGSREFPRANHQQPDMFGSRDLGRLHPDYLGDYPTVGSSRGSSGGSGRSSNLAEIYPSMARDHVPLPGRKQPGKAMSGSQLSGYGPDQPEPPCCSYRVKTSEKYSRYPTLHKLKFRALYMGLINHTTAHGLPHIHLAQGCIKKGFWIVLTLGLIAAWLWNAQSVLWNFLDFGVTVTYDIRTEPKLPFPAVTICNQNAVRASMLMKDNSGSELINQPPPRRGPNQVCLPDKGCVQEQERPQPGSGPGPNGGNGGVATDKSDDALRKKLIQEFLARLSLQKKMEYGHHFKPLIASCEFSGYTCYNTTFKQSYDATYGNCFTFNTGANGTDGSFYAYRTGPDNGLAIHFAIEQDQYVGPISPKAGIRLVIHSSDTPAFPADHGIDIPPGQASSVGIRKVMVSRLGGRYDNCLSTAVSHKDINVYEQIYPWTRYTLVGCQKTCYQRELMMNCSCFDQDFPSQGDAFNAIDHSGFQVCNTSDAIEFACKNNIYDQFINAALTCPACIKTCEEEYYSTTISSTKWPARNYIPTLRELFEGDRYFDNLFRDEEIADDVGLLEVYFESLNLEEMIEQPAYEISQFIADIGGSIGLWVGASVMTIFEFGEFFLDALILCCAKSLRGSGSPQKRPPVNRNNNRNVPRKMSRPVPEIRVAGTPQTRPDQVFSTGFNDTWHDRKMASGNSTPWPGHQNGRQNGLHSSYTH